MKKIFQLMLLLLVTYTANAQDQVDNLINDMLKVANNFATPGAEAAALQSSA
ncbi:hypothetical protein LZ575_11555 [Antarcticibacterium sp. 1MA-6-2]|uniref:hypothetical protein n=1 Tax=Antarcticibacterium sp. 1MA-6-2 TaxID=2908210 RepID=UPI001F4523B9|nr:hypothetical protein [Antarcticibacterium sp. 1MA-6-2]UJH89700.1 hypothetical protein LZ575_11555 [Antarcticibacterium sp. 1MA-6-2]